MRMTAPGCQSADAPAGTSGLDALDQEPEILHPRCEYFSHQAAGRLNSKHALDSIEPACPYRHSPRLRRCADAPALANHFGEASTVFDSLVNPARANFFQSASIFRLARHEFSRGRPEKIAPAQDKNRMAQAVRCHMLP